MKYLLHPLVILCFTISLTILFACRLKSDQWTVVTVVVLLIWLHEQTKHKDRP